MIARAVVLAPWLVFVAVEVSAAPWLDQSTECLASLRHVDEGTELHVADRTALLKTVCPALSQALRDDPWGDVLTVPVESLSVWSIEDLAVLAVHYRGAPGGPRVAPGPLDSTLAALPESVAAQQATLWELLRDWLREWFGGGDGVLSDWLPAMSVNDTAARWLLYGTAALIVLMAAALVFTEVRYWHRRRRRDAAGLPAPPAGPLPGAEPVPGGRTPAERLQGLFAAVVDRLQVAGLLPARPSLTHREVAYHAQLSAAQRDVVGLLGRAAERVRFGAWTPAPADVTAHIEAGSRLLEELAEIQP